MSKVKNVDKYREEFLEVIEDDSAVCLTSRFLTILGVDVDCRISCVDCTRSLLGMLFSEYHPPLLLDGYGLNAGDWLEIEDDNDGRWYKGRFIGYLDGRFYVKHQGDQNLFGVSSSVHARLPEEGE